MPNQLVAMRASSDDQDHVQIAGIGNSRHSGYGQQRLLIRSVSDWDKPEVFQLIC